MLNGRDVALGRVPDVLDRVVVGRVRRRMDRCDAFQQPAGPVEAGQRFRVVGSGVVRDDRDLAASVSRWSGSGARVVCQVFRFCSVGYGVTVLLVGGRAPEKDWDVLCRSTDGLVRCPLLGAACGGSRPRARGGPRLPCRPSGPGPTGF